MDLFSYAILGNVKVDRNHFLYADDEDGRGTIQALRSLKRVMGRITGNDSPSLGLHPAVYFYSQTGRHWDMIFISIINVFAKAIRNNDGEFFKKFTKNRRIVEDIFLRNKALIGQANIAIRSGNRIAKWSQLIEDTARGKTFASGISPDEILEHLDLKGKVIASEISEVGQNFSDTTKSAIFLRDSISSAHKCPVCGGLVLAEKSVSYDHIVGKAEGGFGSVDNLQMTHPYCNSIKESLELS